MTAKGQGQVSASTISSGVPPGRCPLSGLGQGGGEGPGFLFCSASNSGGLRSFRNVGFLPTEHPPSLGLLGCPPEQAASHESRSSLQTLWAPLSSSMACRKPWAPRGPRPGLVPPAALFLPGRIPHQAMAPVTQGKNPHCHPESLDRIPTRGRAGWGGGRAGWDQSQTRLEEQAETSQQSRLPNSATLSRSQPPCASVSPSVPMGRGIRSSRGPVWLSEARHV